jgi:hypothetical protein
MIGIVNLIAQNRTTFNAVPFQILIGDVPLDLTGAIIEIDVKKDACSTPILALTSVDSAGITITDAVDGWFSINEQYIDVKPCNYQYDIKITLADLSVKRYVGGLFQVVTTITN